MKSSSAGYGDSSNIPPEVLDRFKRHGQMYATQDILAWTSVDEESAGSVWRANHADYTANGMGFLLLPCFWPHAIIMGLCCGFCCLLELATTSRAKSDASMHYIVTNFGLSSVRMELYGAMTEAVSVQNTLFLQLDTVSTDTKKPQAQLCHTCCCVPNMSRVEVYDSQTSEEKCWGTPTVILNGVKNHEWFAEEIRKMEKAARENPTLMALGQANAVQMQQTMAQAMAAQQVTAAQQNQMEGRDGASSVTERLEAVESLRAQGLISQEEYALKRSDILGSL